MGLAPGRRGSLSPRVAAQGAYDPDELGAAAAASGNPVVPLAAWLARDVAEQDEAAAGWVHRGATSQDILDTALMIVAAEATGRLLAPAGPLRRRAGAAGPHPRVHPDGRPHPGPGRGPDHVRAQGHRVAGGRRRRGRRLRDSRARLAVQLGGPVGTGAAWSPSLPDLLPAFAQATGLASAVPWHTERSRVVELATSLGQAVAACAKIATDVIALSQNEIGELREGAEPGRGGSSAMPHKQNPVGSVLVRAAALRSPGLVATVLSAAVHEGERATGAWHAEWAPLRELLHLAGGAGALTADVLERLEVDEQRMADRVTGAGSVMFAESVSRALSGPLGRAEAQEVVAAAARSTRADRHAVPRRPGGGPPRHRTPGRRRAGELLRPRRPRPGRRRPGGPDPVPQRHTGGPMTIALAHDVRGDDAAPALILGSSLGTTRAMWDPQHEALAQRLRVVRYDHPGHGASPAPPAGTTLADLGRSVLDLADRLELQRFSYAGLSLGGMVGMWLAIHAPERVDRLALLCTSAHLPPALMWRERAATVRAAGTCAAISESVVSRWFTPEFAQRRPGRRRVVHRHPGRGRPGGLRRLLRGHRRDGPARRVWAGSPPRHS